MDQIKLSSSDLLKYCNEVGFYVHISVYSQSKDRSLFIQKLRQSGVQITALRIFIIR